MIRVDVEVDGMVRSTRIPRADLVIIDLCRHRDYAEALAVAGFA